jgi:gamma-glutamyltranspeptidase/glutathione hydrolase
MRDQFSNAQQIRKPAVVSKGGIVAAQSRKAAEVGAEVRRRAAIASMR